MIIFLMVQNMVFVDDDDGDDVAAVVVHIQHVLLVDHILIQEFLVVVEYLVVVVDIDELVLLEHHKLEVEDHDDDLMVVDHMYQMVLLFFLDSYLIQLVLVLLVK